MGLVIASAVVTFIWIYDPAIAAPENSVEIVVDQPAAELAQPVSELEKDNAGSWIAVFSESGIYLQRHLPLLVVLWLLGVMVLTLRTLGELTFIQYLRYNRSTTASQHWQQRLRELTGRMGLHTGIELRESRRIHTPMVIGVLKPVILLPLGMAANLPPEQVESALAHELAHIRRHDYFVNLLQSFVEILFFFNPGIWWLSASVRAEREHCCDDWAVEVCGDELTFVKTLATLEEYRVKHAGLVVALAGSRGSVLGRIQRLLHGRQSAQLPFRIFWSTLVCLLFFGLAAFSWTSTAPKQRNTAVETEQAAGSEITRLDSVPPEHLNEVEESPGAPSSENGLEDSAPLSSNATTLTTSAISNRTPAKPLDKISPSILSDTIPESEKAYRKAKLELQKEYRESLLELQKQRKPLSSQVAELRTKLNQEENVRVVRALEVKKKIQLLQNGKELERKELEIELNELQGEINEIEGSLQQLEQQTIEEMATENPDKEN